MALACVIRIFLEFFGEHSRERPHRTICQGSPWLLPCPCHQCRPGDGGDGGDGGDDGGDGGDGGDDGGDDGW